MPQDSVYTRRDGVIATIFLNRPAKKNALTLDMWDLLARAIEAADRDTGVKVIVVTGEGDAFAAGADIEELEQSFDDPRFGSQFAEILADSQKRIQCNVKPTIAAIRGPCIGGGCAIALNCDFRIADSTARFGITPAKLGIAYSLAETKRLMDVVGAARAKDMLFSARTLTAEEAMGIGLIDRLVAPSDLNGTVRDYATQIAGMSQYSIRATKRIVQMILDGAAEENRDSHRMFVDAFSGADFKEGIQAFMQRRKPTFPVA
jgi:enoyl-CoA hydratase/carnithine racemase